MLLSSPLKFEIEALERELDGIVESLGYSLVEIVSTLSAEVQKAKRAEEALVALLLKVLGGRRSSLAFSLLPFFTYSIQHPGALSPADPNPCPPAPMPFLPPFSTGATPTYRTRWRGCKTTRPRWSASWRP